MKFLQGTGNGKERIYADDKAAIVSATLEKGSVIPAHMSTKNVMVTIVKGKVFFDDGKGNGEEIYPSKVVYMVPGELHSLTAIEDSQLMIIHF